MSTATNEKVGLMDMPQAGTHFPMATVPEATVPEATDVEAQISKPETQGNNVAQRTKRSVKVRDVTAKLGAALTICAIVWAIILPAIFGGIIAIGVNLNKAVYAMEHPSWLIVSNGLARRDNSVDVPSFSVPANAATPSAASGIDTTLTWTLTSTSTHTSTSTVDPVVTVTVLNGSLEPNSATVSAICTPQVTVTVTVAVTVDPLQGSSSSRGTPSVATSRTSTSSSSNVTSHLSTLTTVEMITTTIPTDTTNVPASVSTFNVTSTFPHTTTFIKPTGTAHTASGSLVPVSTYNATWTAPIGPHHTVTSDGSSTKPVKKTRGGGSAVSYCVMMAVIFVIML